MSRWLSVLLLLCACDDAPAPVQCGNDGDCASGRVCVMAECVPLEGDATVAPDMRARPDMTAQRDMADVDMAGEPDMMSMPDVGGEPDMASRPDMADDPDMDLGIAPDMALACTPLDREARPVAIMVARGRRDAREVPSVPRYMAYADDTRTLYLGDEKQKRVLAVDIETSQAWTVIGNGREASKTPISHAAQQFDDVRRRSTVPVHGAVLPTRYVDGVAVVGPYLFSVLDRHPAGYPLYRMDRRTGRGEICHAPNDHTSVYDLASDGRYLYILASAIGIKLFRLDTLADDWCDALQAGLESIEVDPLLLGGQVVVGSDHILVYRSNDGVAERNRLARIDRARFEAVGDSVQIRRNHHFAAQRGAPGRWWVHRAEKLPGSSIGDVRLYQVDIGADGADPTANLGAVVHDLALEVLLRADDRQTFVEIIDITANGPTTLLIKTAIGYQNMIYRWTLADGLVEVAGLQDGRQPVPAGPVERGLGAAQSVQWIDPQVVVPAGDHAVLIADRILSVVRRVSWANGAPRVVTAWTVQVSEQGFVPGRTPTGIRGGFNIEGLAWDGAGGIFIAPYCDDIFAHPENCGITESATGDQVLHVTAAGVTALPPLGGVNQLLGARRPRALIKVGQRLIATYGDTLAYLQLDTPADGWRRWDGGDAALPAEDGYWACVIPVDALSACRPTPFNCFEGPEECAHQWENLRLAYDAEGQRVYALQRRIEVRIQTCNRADGCGGLCGRVGQGEQFPSGGSTHREWTRIVSWDRAGADMRVIDPSDDCDGPVLTGVAAMDGRLLYATSAQGVFVQGDGRPLIPVRAVFNSALGGYVDGPEPGRPIQDDLSQPYSSATGGLAAVGPANDAHVVFRFEDTYKRAALSDAPITRAPVVAGQVDPPGTRAWADHAWLTAPGRLVTDGAVRYVAGTDAGVVYRVDGEGIEVLVGRPGWTEQSIAQAYTPARPGPRTEAGALRGVSDVALRGPDDLWIAERDAGRAHCLSIADEQLHSPIATPDDQPIVAVEATDTHLYVATSGCVYAARLEGICGAAELGGDLRCVGNGTIRDIAVQQDVLAIATEDAVEFVGLDGARLPDAERHVLAGGITAITADADGCSFVVTHGSVVTRVDSDATQRVADFGDCEACPGRIACLAGVAPTEDGLAFTDACTGVLFEVAPQGD